MDRLLSWYRAHGRDLPWRGASDPWAIWVSEIMLQQTRVETVGPYWQRFMERFPTPAALAAAEEQEVLRHWAGLGYYRRARLLHKASQEVVEQHAGVVPRDPARFLSLPGVGRYTAGAVMSIAHNLAEPIVDGNVIRVLCRLFRIGGDPRKASNQRRLWQLAEELIPPGRAGDFNQALMDLGATVCVPRNPRCDDCPLQVRCEAYAAGTQAAFPEAGRKTQVKALRAACGVLQSASGEWLMARRPDGGLLAGMWEFPSVDLRGKEKPEKGLVRGFLAELELELTASAVHSVGEVEHLFTHRRLVLSVFRCSVWRGQPCSARYPELRWVASDGLDALPLPRLTRKAIAALAAGASRD